jgi:hypothetical protein
MPANLTYPGVYVEELPSAARSIAGVATSKTAFLGRALRGRNEPIEIKSFGDFARRFGGIWRDAPGYAVQHYFANGGAEAIIVRLANGGSAARYSLTPESGVDPLCLTPPAWAPGATGSEITVDHQTRDTADTRLFNLQVIERDPDSLGVAAAETHRNVSLSSASPRYLGRVLDQESALLRLPSPYPGTFPAVRPDDSTTPATRSANGSDGNRWSMTTTTPASKAASGASGPSKSRHLQPAVHPALHP